MFIRMLMFAIIQMQGAVKYDLIVKPGADISTIALKYDGPDKLELKNKELIIKTSVGNLRELNPYTYQSDENRKKRGQVVNTF